MERLIGHCAIETLATLPIKHFTDERSVSARHPALNVAVINTSRAMATSTCALLCLCTLASLSLAQAGDRVLQQMNPVMDINMSIAPGPMSMSMAGAPSMAKAPAMMGRKLQQVMVSPAPVL